MTYELRTMRGTAVMAFDSLARAKAEQQARAQRGVRLDVWQVERSERKVA